MDVAYMYIYIYIYVSVFLSLKQHVTLLVALKSLIVCNNLIGYKNKHVDLMMKETKPEGLGSLLRNGLSYHSYDKWRHLSIQCNIYIKIDGVSSNNSKWSKQSILEIK